MNPHFEMLERAHRELIALGEPFVFVGGATISLHIDDPAAGPVRVTNDVDLVVEVVGYAEYSIIEAQLRDLDFEQDLSGDAPICRWMKDDLLIDVLPTEPEILGFASSKWFTEGFRHARSYELPTGTTIKAFAPIYLLAAKIEAFEDRGDGDWHRSQDIDDIATILDARRAIFDELAADSRAAIFVRSWLKQEAGNLIDPIAEHANDYGRAHYLVERLQLMD